MIVGIGVDLTSVERFSAALDRHGERLARRILSPSELTEWQQHGASPRFLAKRFAAKEAFAKAWRTGVRGVINWHALSLIHDASGAPSYGYAGELAALIKAKRCLAHLSLCDEADQVVAMAVIEQRT